MKTNLIETLEQQNNNITFEICCFMGKARSGKTLSLVETGYNIFLTIKRYCFVYEHTTKTKSKTETERYNLFKSIKLMSNMLNLNKNVFGKYLYLSFEMLIEMYEKKIEIKHYIILLDDLFKDLDNRDFFKKNNKVFSYFLSEIGKKQNILLYVSHFENLIEMRLKNFTEKYILCKKGEFKTIDLGERKIKVFVEYPNYYDLDINVNRKNFIVIQQNILQNYISLNSSEIEIKKRITERKYILAKTYFNMYKTGEVI